MPIQVTTGAMLQCSFGATPSPLLALPTARVMAGGVPAATIMDHIPVANIPPFGACAAIGVCAPLTPLPWLPGAPTVLIGGLPALDNTCKLMCLWGGMIQIVTPAQMTVLVP